MSTPSKEAIEAADEIIRYCIKLPAKDMRDIIQSAIDKATEDLRKENLAQTRALELAAQLNTGQGCPDENHVVVLAANDALNRMSK